MFKSSWTTRLVVLLLSFAPLIGILSTFARFHNTNQVFNLNKGKESFYFLVDATSLTANSLADRQNGTSATNHSVSGGHNNSEPNLRQPTDELADNKKALPVEGSRLFGSIASKSNDHNQNYHQHSGYSPDPTTTTTTTTDDNKTYATGGRSIHNQIGGHNLGRRTLLEAGFATGGSGNSVASSVGSAKNRSRRHLANNQELGNECEFAGGGRKPALYGLRCDDAETTDDGAIIVRAHESTRMFLIGRNLYSNLTVALTEQDGATQDDCTHADRVKSFKLNNLNLNVAEIYIELPQPDKLVPYYLCIREDQSNARWYHQGSDPWLKIYVKKDIIPFWLKCIIIACLLSLSGLFSGLNLGLMALDKNELQVIMKCGNEDEKHYATVIEPVRRRGNYLLCSILFSNTLVNSTISVLLEELSDGLIAVITSTVLIVLFGEILPQAFCSRHGLAVGAKTIWLTNFCMFITFPLSWPVSSLLDWALGEEICRAYDRERLTEFIKVTKDINNLETDEVNIITGALKIKQIQISEVMTRIEDVYMIDENALLDFDTIQEIVGKGYSRIPVHETGNRRNIKAVLFAKDLALVDPDQKTPVQTMVSFFKHQRMFVYEDTTLDKVLNEFKTGSSHMAIVQRVINDGDMDPYYEVTGIVTLEDIIEEIMQMEINDETDIVSDNRRKRRRKDTQVRKDFSQFANLGSGDSSFNVVTQQLCLAAYQYLSTTVEPFTPKYLSTSILQRLLSQKIFYKVRGDDDETARRLYTAGEPADYFIMILEGRVHVVCGKEKLVFDGGPFSFFGKAALNYYGERADSVANLTPSRTTQGSLVAATGTSSQPNSSSSVRKESTRQTGVLSRRESLAKIVTNQLSLTTKKPEPSAMTGESSFISPTKSAVSGQAPETMMTELVEKGLYFFKPDYTVDIIADTAYLKVTRNDYLTALKATRVEREGLAQSGGDDNDDDNENRSVWDGSLVIESSGRDSS